MLNQAVCLQCGPPPNICNNIVASYHKLYSEGLLLKCSLVYSCSYSF